jgi:hypothetical protein
MIIEKQIEIAKALIATGLVDSVFHSCELVEDEKGTKFPAYKVGNEQFYCGPDDRKKMFAYIRNSGPAFRIIEGKESSEDKLYRMSAPHRIAVFQDHVKDDFDALTKRLLKVAFIKDVSLVSFNSNAFQLSKQESPIGNFSFDATTFYLAIDVQIKFWFYANQCDSDSCVVFPNPIN